jgi:CelD/BcsL family acetyltransferase involved in cellulose biosynthesis
MLVRTTLGVRLLRFLGTPNLPQRTAILAAPGDEERVVEAVAGALGRARPRSALVNLDRIDGGERWARIMARAWPTPLGASLSSPFTVSAPVLSMSGRSFDEWLAGKSSNFRKEVRRTRRKVETAGAVIRRVAGPADLAPALDAFARLHGARWGERSNLWHAPTIAMLNDAGATMVEAGRMRVYVAEAGDDVIAVEILFAAGGEVSSWNTAWNPAWAEARLSMAALYQAIEDCFDEGDARLDLGEGEQPYKARLTDGDDPVSWITITPRGRAYPAALSIMAPRYARRSGRSLLRRLPKDAQLRIRRVLRRPPPGGS